MRRMIVGLLASVIGPGAASAQTPAPDAALAVYAKPQRLVKLPDGRRIHLFCQGKGSPTVILTAGLGGWAIAYAKVQPAVAARARACAWDRAGYGHSDASPLPQTLANTTADLEQALVAGGIKGPYILAGHSAGAYETLRFADRHRKDVLGIVLIDPSVPDQAVRMAAIAGDTASTGLAAGAALLRGCGKGVENGTIKPGDGVGKACFNYGSQSPAELTAALTAHDSQPGQFATKASLTEAFAASSAAVVDPARSYGDLPLIVLTQGKGLLMPGATAEVGAKLNAAWIGWHDDYAHLSNQGLNLIVRDAGHLIPQEKPQAVIGAISAVLDAAM